ncbi:MAG: LamG-like jellyroll fold domain-containing protein [Betaproteobacteria bacterium]
MFGQFNSTIGINDDGAGGKLTWVYMRGSGDYPQARSSTTINDNKWHHCVVVNTGGSGKGSIDMYVDGVKEVSAFEHDQNTSSYPYSTNAYFLANSLMKGDLAFDSDGSGNTNRIPADDPESSQGAMLDYRVYSRALTAREVNNIIAPHSNHSVETSLILNSTSTEDNIFNERFSLRGRYAVNWNDQQQRFFQQYGLKPRFPNIPHEPYSSRQRSYSVRKAYNSTLKYKDSTPISVHKNTPIGDIDRIGHGKYAYNVGTNIVRKISGQYIPFTLGLDSDSDIYNITFTDSDSFSDYNIPATRLDAIAGEARVVDVETDVDTQLPEIKRIEGYGINVAASTEVQDDGFGGNNSEDFELPFSWSTLLLPTIIETFFDYTDYGRIDFDLVIDATWARYNGTENDGLLQTNIENWFVKVNDVILDSYRTANDTRVTYRFTWLNPRFFEKDTVAIPTDRYCNLRTADDDVFGGDGEKAYGRNPIIGSQAFFSGGDEQDKSFKLVLIDKDGTEQVGWPSIFQDDTKTDFSVNLRVDYQYKNTRNIVIDRYFGRMKAGIHDTSVSEVPLVKKITAAYGTEVMDIISHVSYKKTSNDSRLDTDYQVGTRDTIQIAKELVLFDDSDDVTKQYLQEEDGITGLVPDPLAVAQVMSNDQEIFTPTQRNKVIWGAHTYQNNLSNAQAGSYMDMPWQDMANYLGFKIEFDANALKPEFGFELHFAGIWGEYWHKDDDGNTARMWVNHVRGEDEYTVDGIPNLQNYNHTPITNSYHTDCWPFSYKMKENGILPEDKLDGANYRIVERDDGKDLFIVGKIHQFWRDGAHPHLMIPGLSIAPKDQTLEVWKFKNYNPRQLTLTLQCPDDRIYLGAGSSEEPRLGMLTYTPISNNKIGSEYGTLSSLAKCDARAKDRSGFYPERGKDTGYGQNLTQVYHDLDLYGYTTGALNYGHTNDRILELPSVSPWTTENPWSGSAIGDKVLPGRGLSIDPRYYDNYSGNYPTADLETDPGGLSSMWLQRGGSVYLVTTSEYGIPRFNNQGYVFSDRIRSSAHILNIISSGAGGIYTWPTDETRIKYGWRGGSDIVKENPYDLVLHSHGNANYPIDYFNSNNIVHGGEVRLQEDKNVSRKRTLESGNGIPLSEWYRQYKVTPAHFHVSRIQNVDRKLQVSEAPAGASQVYRLVRAKVMAQLLNPNVSTYLYRDRNFYYAGVVKLLRHIKTGEEIPTISIGGPEGVIYFENGEYPQLTFNQAENEVNKIFGINNSIQLGAEQITRLDTVIRVKNYYLTFVGINSSGFTEVSTNGNAFVSSALTLAEDDDNPNILLRPTDTFYEIGSLLQGFEKNGEISLTDTADCTHANLYCRWHLKYKNNAGEEGIFFQIPWNMTKDNTSFSNYLLQIENQKYDGTTVNRSGKTINTAINYFSEFVTNHPLTPGGAPDNIPASALVRDMFRLKGENSSEIGDNKGFSEDKRDKESLGYYYPSSKAALRYLDGQNTDYLNHRTDKGTVTSDGLDLFKLSDRMPRMTATVKDVSPGQSQPELISFVDYAPINNYETTLDKFQMNSDPEVILSTMKFYRRGSDEQNTWAGLKSGTQLDKGYPTNEGFFSVIPASDATYIRGDGRPRILSYEAPTRSNNYVMTIGLQSPGDGCRVVITDERPGTPPGQRTVVAECHVYSGSTATFEVPVIQDPDPGDRATLSVSGGGEVNHYNPVIVDWKNSFRLGDTIVRGANIITPHGWGPNFSSEHRIVVAQDGSHKIRRIDNSGVPPYAMLTQNATADNGYKARVSLRTHNHDGENTAVSFQLWQEYFIRGIKYIHPVMSAYTGGFGDALGEVEITTYTPQPTPKLSGGDTYERFTARYDNGNRYYADKATDGTPNNMYSILYRDGEPRDFGTGAYINDSAIGDIYSSGYHTIQPTPDGTVPGDKSYMTLGYTNDQDKSFPGKDSNAVYDADGSLGQPDGENGSLLGNGVGDYIYTKKGTFVHPDNPDATLTAYSYDGGAYLKHIYYYHPLTARNVINGYPALVPNGIVPENHNRLLGLPHILNHPDPTNLIFPTQP